MQVKMQAKPKYLSPPRQKANKPRLPVRLLCILWLALANVAAVPVQEAPPIRYERYDVTLDVQANGDILVRETQQIRFGGEFQTAFAEIPRALTSAIEDVRVYEGDVAYRRQASAESAGAYSVTEEGDTLAVQWGYTPTAPGEVRIFTLAYTVVGGLWVYPDEQQLEWRAVPADRSGIPVEASTVTVNLPSPVSADQLRQSAYGPDYSAQVEAGRVVFKATETIPDGVAFQVQVGFPPALTTAQVQDWQRREDQAALAYRIPALAVDLTIHSDSTLTVEETQRIVVAAGVLDQGSRTIPLRFLDGIENISLFEGEQEFSRSEAPCEYCFQVASTPREPAWARLDTSSGGPQIDDDRTGRVDVNWQFPPLARGEETTFRLRYDVQGALRLYEDGQLLDWTVVYPDRAAAVENTTLRLHLPPGIDPANVALDENGGTLQSLDEDAILVNAPSNIAPGRSWSIQLTLPPGATRASKSAWQQDLEELATVAQQAEVRRARLQVGLVVAALLILVVGLPGVYLLWYRRGRDKPAPMVADYLPEPPSDLPPAIVAYLLDEEATTKGALASLFQLANLGLLQVNLNDNLAFRRVREEALTAGTEIETPAGGRVKPPGHLVMLFNQLLPVMPLGEEVALRAVEPRFRASLPAVYAQMGDEATAFFDERPDRARRRWSIVGWLVLALALLLSLFSCASTVDAGAAAFAPALALAVVGVALLFVSRWMARRTDKGVEEASRWRAFRTYLQNLKRYGDLAAAQEMLDRYFAYAVALDVEETVLEQAAELGGHIPPWTYTPTWHPRPHWPTQPAPTVAAPGGLPVPSTAGSTASPAPSQSTPPSLSGLSRSWGNSLSRASRDLAAVLNRTAGDTAAHSPFERVGQHTGEAGSQSGSSATALNVLGEILRASSSGGGGGGFSRSASSRRSSGWSPSRSSRSSSSRSSAGRSSSSRRSGGGGRRGFG